MKHLPIVVFRECPCEGPSINSLCVTSGFDGRAGSHVIRNHVFSQCVLAVITLVIGGGEAWGRLVIETRTRARFEQVPRSWSRCHDGQIPTGLVPSKCELSYISALTPSPQRGASLEQEGMEWALGVE